MRKLGYSKSYIYPHDYENNFKQQDYLPQEIKGKHFYEAGKNARENEYLEKLKVLWKGKYGY
jgi:putative ATPase